MLMLFRLYGSLAEITQKKKSERRRSRSFSGRKRGISPGLGDQKVDAQRKSQQRIFIKKHSVD